MPSAPPPPSPLGLQVFGPILAVHFLGTLGFSLAIPFLVFIVDDLGGAAWTYGFVAATFSAFQLVGAPVLGKWSDRVGRRRVLIVSQVGSLVAWLLFLVALSMPKNPLVEIAGAALTIPLVVIFLARALDGATGGNISVANAYVADLTDGRPELQSRAFGQMGMASSLGFVLGPAASGTLGGTSLGASLPVALAALLAAVTTAAIFFGLRRNPRLSSSEPTTDAPSRAADRSADIGEFPRDAGLAPHDDVNVFKPPVITLVIAAFVLFVAFSSFYSGFPTHANSALKWDAGKLGMFFAILSAASVVTQGPVLTFASRRVSRRVLFAVGMGLLAGAFFLMQLPEGPLTYVGAILFALGNGISWPTFLARVAEVGGHAQGKVQGVTTSATSAASIVGLLAGGVLYPSLGGQLFLVGASLFLLLGLLTFVWFPPTSHANDAAVKN